VSSAPFTRRAIVGLAILGGASLLAGLIAAGIGGELKGQGSAGPDSFSSSALGHRAFVELLRRLDVPVVISRGRSARRSADEAVLLIAEPHLGGTDEGARELGSLLSETDRTLVVLPRWTGTEDPDRPGWIARAAPIGGDRVSAVFEALGIEALAVRASAPPARWDHPSFTCGPALEAPQLVDSGELTAWIGCDEGVLLGELPPRDPESGSRCLLLSDPGLLSNAGLGEGRNAAMMLEILHFLAPEGAPVVIDETLHGFAIARGLLAELLRFPLVLALAHAGLAAALLLWAGMRRFGAPQPLPSALRAGKRTLIDNTAELLLLGGHGESVLQRYLSTNLRRVADALHLPPELDVQRRLEALEGLSRRMKASIRPRDLVSAVRQASAADRGSPRRFLRTARLIHRWREEMTHGAR